MEHLISHSIYDGEGHLGAVFGGVVMHTKWPLTEGRIDDFHDRSCHTTRVGVVWDDSAKRLLDLVTITGIRAGFVCCDAGKIRRSPGAGEWLVPFVKAPGTMIEVSMPQRDSSRAYCTASASIPALAAK